MPTSDSLAHFGVKGMKWGVRKAEQFNATASADAKQAKELGTTAKKVGTHALSNKDYEALLKRMELDQRYARLSERKKSEGEKWVTDQLKQVGQQELKKLALKYGAKFAGEMLKGLL